MTTTLEFYGHPFASFVWKPLIALYERDVTFMFRMIDPAHRALSPTGQFPALLDGDSLQPHCSRHATGSMAEINAPALSAAKLKHRIADCERTPV